MSVKPALEYLEKTTTEPVSACVIWLHGLGADGNDFVPIVDEMRQSSELGIRFIFPHAPVQPVSINGGMAMRAWYDIIGLGDGGIEEDANGISDARANLEELVAHQQERGIAAERIVLAGFSQGAATALFSGVQMDPAPAGVLALSGWLPAATPVPSPDGLENLPLFMAHGKQDPIVPLRLGQDSQRRLTEAGYNVEWHEFAMEHAVCMPEIEQADRWLYKLLTSQATRRRLDSL